MSEMWHDPSVTTWWLPNNEKFHPILQSIRAFSEERASRPRDDKGEGLRDMKAIFSKLNISDSTSPPQDSPGSQGSEAAGGQTSMSAVVGGGGDEGKGGPVIGEGWESSSHQVGGRGKKNGGNRISGVWEGGMVS